MKPKNREINIFNMSLLDVLCGALGAFCFLMLVLFPYYSTDKNKTKAPELPPGMDPKNYEEAMARIKQLVETLQKFQNYSAQLEGQASKLNARVKELEANVQKSSSKVEQLEFRNPFLVLVKTQSAKDDDTEIWVEDDRVTTGDRHSPKLDPNQRQGASWAGDAAFSGPNLDVGYFLVRDGPPGEFRVFLKVLKHNTAAPPLAAIVLIQTAAERKTSPVFYCTKETMLIPVAVVKIDADYNQKIEFRVPEQLTRPASPPLPGTPEDKK